MQKNYGIKFLSLGGALPSKVVKNTDLEKLFDTSDEWIYTRTGIRERRVVSEGESSLTLSVSAAREALKKSKLDPKDLDLIIVSTTTPDNLYPSTSCLLQGELGAVNAACFDLSAACSGFVFGIVTAAQFIYTGEYKNILLVGVDIHSRFIDWSERSVAILFGDGAGAVIMQSCLAKDDELFAYKICSNADKECNLLLGNKNVTYTNFKKQIEPNFVRMNGKAIYQFAIKVVPDIISKLLDKINLSVSQVDYLVLHQANQRITDAVASRLEFKSSQVISNIKKIGNTSGASIPLAILEGISLNQIKMPCKVLIVGFGAGLTWGASLIKLDLCK
ncbi:MAG: ketoacyl-ACP synthase III [Candidatus Melainabacteria bacterium]|nr:ketoacyl-ACP synthase III [Candidatus Melainabacteria bacterium]